MDRRVPLAAMAALLASSVVVLAAPPETCNAAPYDCAVAHVERLEFADAIRLLEPLARDQPRNLKVLNLLGIALTGAGQTDAANVRFRRALRIDQKFYPSMKNLAVNELEAGRTRQARYLFESVLKHAPADEATHAYLGEIHFAAKAFGTALKHYEQSRARVFSNPTWTLHYAESLLRQGRKGAAIAAFDRLPADDAGIRFEAGLALGRAGAHAEAARFFASARHGYRDPYVAGFNQALMLIEAGDHAAAIAIADEMLSSDPARAELHGLIARAHYGSGRLDEAEKAFDEARRLAPDRPDAHAGLAMVWMQAGQTERSVSALRDLAETYTRMGDKARASELLERVSRLNAAEGGDDPDGELKRTVVRIVKEGSALKPGVAR